MTDDERLKRLKDEFDRLRALVEKSNAMGLGWIDIAAVDTVNRKGFNIIEYASENIPETYLLGIRCKGVRLHQGDVQEIDRHEIFIALDPDYPITPPRLYWETPVYHPNVKAPGVCLLGSWGQRTMLDEVCCWLWDMARYELFNLYDPLDKAAKAWAMETLERDPDGFPLDERDLRSLLTVPDGSRAASAGASSWPGSSPNESASVKMSVAELIDMIEILD